MRKLFFISLISLLFFACSKENSNNVVQNEINEVQTKKTVEKEADLSVENSDNASQKEAPEVQCKKALDKIMKLYFEDPIIKEMPKDNIEKMKAQMSGEENIKKCLKEFNEETIDCIMKAKQFKDIQKCK